MNLPGVVAPVPFRSLSLSMVVFLCTAGAIAPLLLPSTAVGLELFSAGMEVPQTITAVPGDFGSFGGKFFVTDTRLAADRTDGVLWAVPANGGAPELVGEFGFDGRAGVFLPEAIVVEPTLNSPMDIGGQFLVVGTIPSQNPLLDLEASFAAVSASGTITSVPFVTPFGFGVRALPTDAMVAPNGFGDLGNRVVVTDQERGAYSIEPFAPSNPNPQSPVFLFDRVAFQSSEGLMVQAFGGVFAPTDFGSVGGTLLISDAFEQDNAQIVSVDSDGNASIFAEIPTALAGSGLRNMAFVPDGFGDLGGLLLVSISGETPFGGGTLGALIALDESGDIVRVLKQGTDLDKFDPRGLLFVGNTELLICDSSDPILVATPADFVVIPEPGSTMLLGMGWLMILGCERRRRGGASFAAL